MNIEEKIAAISEKGEIWKPCPEFEKKYLISSHGRVMSIGTYNTCKKGKLLRLYKKKGRNGYMQTRLYDDGKARTVEIHTLVAKAFIPNPNNFPMINHIDEDKTNNHVENLEWCNNLYNIRYSRAKAIDIYTKEGKFIETLNAVTDVSDKYGIPVSNISRCCLSKDGVCKGYQFRFKGNPFVPKPPKITRTEKKRLLGIKPREAYYVSIDEYSISGIFIKTWPNISSASREYNLPTTNISKCCKGQIKTINKRIFLLHGEDIAARLLELNKRSHKSKTENVQ